MLSAGLGDTAASIPQGLDLLSSMIHDKQIEVNELHERLSSLKKERDVLQELFDAFGRAGIQSFAYEGVLAELQVQISQHCLRDTIFHSASGSIIST